MGHPSADCHLRPPGPVAELRRARGAGRGWALRRPTTLFRGEGRAELGARLVATAWARVRRVRKREDGSQVQYRQVFHAGHDVLRGDVEPDGPGDLQPAVERSGYL